MEHGVRKTFWGKHPKIVKKYFFSHFHFGLRENVLFKIWLLQNVEKNLKIVNPLVILEINKNIILCITIYNNAFKIFTIKIYTLSVRLFINLSYVLRFFLLNFDNFYIKKMYHEVYKYNLYADQVSLSFFVIIVIRSMYFKMWCIDMICFV